MLEGPQQVGASPQAVLALLPVAQSQIAAQLADADTAATRALAELGLAGALLAVLCAARLASVHLTPWWWVPALGLAGGSVLLGVSLRPFRMDTGRPPQEAFELVAGLQEAEAYYKILSMLDEAQGFNRPLLVGRFKWLRLAEYVLAGTILLGPVILWVSQGVPFP
ncbi:MAG TPA: hypothetical protein VMW80_01115 [Candidatus Dormibacteraeota bacterium]|nr:hypothetical protein [Candidatus Dormibacteraeota bacterium]